MFLFYAADIPDPELDARSAARLDRQLAGLQRLSELALGMAEALPARLAEPDADPAAVALAFSRLSRAIRLTYALENRIADGQLHQAKVARRRQADEVLSIPDDREPHLYRADDLLGEAVEAYTSDQETVERLRREGGERAEVLFEEEDFLNRSVADIVAQICKDLGVPCEAHLFEAEDWVAPRPIEAMADAASVQIHGRPPDERPPPCREAASTGFESGP